MDTQLSTNTTIHNKKYQAMKHPLWFQAFLNRLRTADVSTLRQNTT